MASIKYKNKILENSLLLNQAQKPIQILDAIKWDEETEKFFLKTKFKEIPKVDADYYKDKPLKYDPDKKIEEFRNLRAKFEKDFSSTDELAQILMRNAYQYEQVIEMLKLRGTKEFYKYSKELYGSPTETLNDGKTKLNELATVLDDIMLVLKDDSLGMVYEKNLSSEDVVAELTKRLTPYFENEEIKIKLADGIVSDASAGSDYIKIKRGSKFSSRDIHIFEVHEGWVHLGTTLNGEAQSYAKWLAKGPPCATITQEGLAVIMELFNFALYPTRAKRLNDRLVACTMVEEGANVLEIIEYYRLKGQTESECITNAGRIFRGTDLHGGAPFTKDISYLKGFVEIYNYLRTTVRDGNAGQIPFLFAGKVTLSDVPILYQYHQEGVINFPTYLPPQFKDLNGLAVWMAFSNFFNKMKIEEMKKVERTKIIKIA